MRQILTVILGFTTVTLLFSCGSSKKMSDYVPFTRDLKQKLENQNIDLKDVQFYVDQQLVLNRNLGTQKLAVKNGVVKVKNGKYVNEVVVPMLTPGVLQETDNDRLKISFEKGSNALAFGPGSGFTANNYVLYGTQWMHGTALVNYDSEQFRASCGSCSDVASALLVIRKKEAEKFERKFRTVTGRTVGK